MKLSNILAEDDRLIPMDKVEDLVGLSRKTIYPMIAAGRFPKQVRIGTRSSRWLLSRVRKWMAERVQESACAAEAA